MAKWQNKSIDELTKPELQLALRDAVQALTVRQELLDTQSLYRGLIYGLIAGASMTAFFTLVVISI